MYIETVKPADAEGTLKELYARAGNPDGTIDNVMLAHSLSPESLMAHFNLYVQCMHRPSPLPRLERELVGSVVSRENACGYCLTHHAAGLERLEAKAGRRGLAAAVRSGEESSLLNERESSMVAYAVRLTRSPGEMGPGDVEGLRSAGLSDREILDLAQVTAYFCYANRIVLGLGAELEPFEAGQHPGGQSAGG